MSEGQGPRHVFDIREVCKALDDMAHGLAQELLPLGRWEIKDKLWMDARTDRGGLGDSLKVDIQKARWRHYSTIDKRGDMLELAVYVNGWSKAEALRWAIEDKLGWRTRGGQVLPAAQRPALPPKPAADPAAERRELAEARGKAKNLWLEGQADLRGTPAALYLEQRGIDLGKLYEQRLGLGALRFHPACWCSNIERQIPAMLAQAVRPNGKIATVHRTYLIERAPGKWDRYREDRDGFDGKKLYSKLLGGVVPIWRGRRADKNGVIRQGFGYSDALAGPAIDLTEGIENALSIVMSDSDLRVAAALSMPNATMLRLPEVYTRRYWWRDDDAGNVAIEGDAEHIGLFARMVAHLGAPPNELMIVDPPAGLKDANDALKPVTPSNNQAEDAGSQRRVEESSS